MKVLYQYQANWSSCRLVPIKMTIVPGEPVRSSIARFSVLILILATVKTVPYSSVYLFRKTLPYMDFTYPPTFTDILRGKLGACACSVYQAFLSSPSEGLGTRLSRACSKHLWCIV